jgi:GNAT superfamily N-acetyltransferase
VLELRDVPPDQLASRTEAALARMARLRAAARFLDAEAARQQIEDHAEQTRDTTDMLDVVDGDEVVGGVRLALAGEELLVNDLTLDDPARVAELVPPLVGRARSARARMLGVPVYPGDPGREALAEQPGFVSRATNMALPLDGEIADPDGLELRRMTEAEFGAFMSSMVEDFAGELVGTGMSEEAAGRRSREQMAQLVPDGQQSPGMVFFTARVGGEPVGRLWLCTLDPMAFVYDVEVLEDQRRKGYGAAIMNAGALWSRDQGHPVLGLNVFAHNPGARALYDRLGYLVTQDYRALDVPDAG